jgi:tubulin---tyrosine ligase
MGAALSAALSKVGPTFVELSHCHTYYNLQVRAIALSYGNFEYPTPPEFLDPANSLSVRVIDSLWNDWGRDDDPTHLKAFTTEHLQEDIHKELALKQARGLREGEVDLYAINVPMVPALVKPEGLRIVWTRIWRNGYGRLFENRPASELQERAPHPATETKTADPSEVKSSASDEHDDRLIFKFNPDFKDLVEPENSTLPIGTDAWAIHNDLVSVTPLRASFAEPGAGSMGFGSEWQESPLGGPRAGGGRYWDN